MLSVGVCNVINGSTRNAAGVPQSPSLIPTQAATVSRGGKPAAKLGAGEGLIGVRSAEGPWIWPDTGLTNL